MLLARSAPGALAIWRRLISDSVVEDCGFTSSGAAETSTCCFTEASANWKWSSLPVPELTWVCCDCGVKPSADDETSYIPAGTAVKRNAPFSLVRVSCSQSDDVE